ncbi:hypothetical protein HOLleu_20795 [Holothuria leucospilota]|uniref:Uncharacterized protein n=1 Tax=Holothuria leucospilota TaxID=206669 RepID=A0A9Q1H8Q3_HOLLE|nr:hypothetical protein HOLleu_20795 [Holothuria leucospilota]
MISLDLCEGSTIASPVSHIDRSKRSDEGDVIPILVPPTNVSLYSSASHLKATTLERFQSNIATGTDFTGEIVQTGFDDDQQTPKQLTREERATRSRSRTRSSGSRSSKRTSTSTSNRSRHSMISSGDIFSTPSRRTGGSHRCRTGMCDEGRPTIVRVVRSMRRQLYRLLSRILGEEFTPPESLTEDIILTLLAFLRQHGGEDGQNFLNRVRTTHSAMVTVWEQCCQTYSTGRRKRSTSFKLDQPVDLSELAVTLIVYSIQR